MSEDGEYDVRAEMLEMLMQKIEEQRYPTATMLNMVEELLTPEDVPRYAELLLDRIRSDQFPSIPMMARLKKLG